MSRASLLLLALLVGCSSKSHSSADSTPDAGDDGGTVDPGPDGGGPPGMITEHGTLIDYGTLLASKATRPVAGLVVTDGDQTATTDAQGNWSLTLPATSVLSPSIAGSALGNTYATLFLPDGTSTGGDVDRGTIVVADQSTFSLERLILSGDTSKAVVHVAAIATGACASVAGGTISVTSPPGASVSYFDANGYPSTSATAFPDLPFPGPVAVLYDVDPSASLEFTVSHPTCQPVANPITTGGASFTGQVTMKAAEPGDYVSAVLTMLQ